MWPRRRSVLKAVGLVFMVASILAIAAYMGLDAYQNGSPFSLEPVKPITVTYPFSIYLSNQSRASAIPDLRGAVSLTFTDTAVAGEDIGVEARILIPPSAYPMLRNGTAAVAIFIPGTTVSSKFNDSTFGIPNDYVLVLLYDKTVNGTIIYDTGGVGLPVYFPDQGDYRVFVGVQTYHYSTGLVQAPNMVIHVEPRSIRLSILLGKESRAFTFALLIFAAMDGLTLVPKLYRRSLFEHLAQGPNHEAEESEFDSE